MRARHPIHGRDFGGLSGILPKDPMEHQYLLFSVRQWLHIAEMRRVLKPGAIFLCYEWCLADRYDLGCAEHVTIKKQIEEGGGLPDIALTHHCLAALREAGFEILEERDLVNDEYGGWQVPSTGEYLTGAEASPGRQALVSRDSVFCCVIFWSNPAL